MLTKWRFRCYPTSEQAQHLSRTFGCVRVVYNHFLKLRGDVYRDSGKGIGYAETSRLLTSLKKRDGTTFLAEVSSIPLQQSLRHLQRAFDGFFEKRSAYPSFKKKNRRQGAEYTRSGFTLEGKSRQLRIAKIGRLKVRWSRDIPVEPSSVTITRTTADRYFVTLTLDVPDPVSLPKSESVVGVDLGINQFATLSTGEKIANPRHLGKRLKQLARLQRVLARRIKGSNRRNQQRQKVARLQERIADARKDTLDKLTTRLVREHGTVVIEDLNVSGMTKNHRLARSLSDAAFGTFRRMIEYKSARMGRNLVIANRFFPSSKLCHACGHCLNSLPLSCRGWQCPACSVKHDRDLNAAINLKNLGAGHALSARGGIVSRTKTTVFVRKSQGSENRPKPSGA